MYVLQVPLLQATMYQLYKVQPFPAQQQGSIFVYIEVKKGYIFVDAMRHKYGKMNYEELETCFKPNELNYVCQEAVPILTYVPNEDCESTLIHPSTISLPTRVCEQSVLRIETPSLIPLHMSNEWLYVTPKSEIFTVLCGSRKFQLTLQKRGKLYLPPRCK